MNLRKKLDKKPIESDTDNEDIPKIDLAEMLEMVDLNKKDVEMNEWLRNKRFTNILLFFAGFRLRGVMLINKSTSYSQVPLLDSAKITIMLVCSRNMASRTKF